MRLDEITNRIVSASASLIAIAALATAVYQAKLSGEQARASVRPYLIQGNSGNNGFASIVQNVGIGPAIINGLEVTVDSQPVMNWLAAGKALGVNLTWNGHRSTTVEHGVVVPAGAVINLLELPDSNDARLFRAQVGRLHVWVCFCSFYGDCWTSETNKYSPVPVKVCRDDPARRFKE